MSEAHRQAVLARLAAGPASPRQLIDLLGISQPTLSRVLGAIGPRLVRLDAGRSIRYALRDEMRGLPEINVYRVDVQGQLRLLGTLLAVRDQGFVMQQQDGHCLHSEGLPWWLYDMRPQGYLGRAFAARHAGSLDLPASLSDWTDTHALRALLIHGHDLVGNLLPGDLARDRFLNTPLPAPIAADHKADQYVQLARAAASGEQPGSSAAGEQPKFTTYAMTPAGPCHVLVKFSEAEPGPVSERWRDLLLAEHLALQTLADAGLGAARSRVLDFAGQRFLEVDRFDRVGPLGRRALHSLTALDAEFAGQGQRPWPALVRQLASAGHVRSEAVRDTELLWAFGTLIGNTDMHTGNLSFIAEHGRPYTLAPTYDMTPMAFRPTSGGRLPDAPGAAMIHADVPNEVWRQALGLAQAYLQRLQATENFSARFAPCVAALRAHQAAAAEKIARLA